MNRYTKNDFTVMPWKNGGGTTTELVRFPRGNEPFYFRLSIAQVSQDGPFSQFPEIDRQLMILSGNGCELTGPEKTIKLLPFQTLFFEGEEVFDCKLINGPVTDFNVMVNREWGRASLNLLESENNFLTCAEDLLYIYDLNQSILHELKKGEQVALSGILLLVSLRLF